MILTTISLVLFAAQSRVDLLDGSKVFGEISDINLSAVTIVVDGSEDATVIANEDILEVVPAATALMRQAQVSLDGLDFMNASNAFAEAASKSEAGYMKSFAGLRNAETLMSWAAIDPRAIRCRYRPTQYLGKRKSSLILVAACTNVIGPCLGKYGRH